LARLRDLPGLGPKSEQWLHEVGIETESQLKQLGAIRAFIRLRAECSIKPSLNFLYALVGAIEGKQWLTVAQNEKGRLLMELEGYDELMKIMESDNEQLSLSK
jgi:DNA transformation protein